MSANTFYSIKVCLSVFSFSALIQMFTLLRTFSFVCTNMFEWAIEIDTDK